MVKLFGYDICDHVPGVDRIASYLSKEDRMPLWIRFYLLFGLDKMHDKLEEKRNRTLEDHLNVEGPTDDEFFQLEVYERRYANKLNVNKDLWFNQYSKLQQKYKLTDLQMKTFHESYYARKE